MKITINPSYASCPDIEAFVQSLASCGGFDSGGTTLHDGRNTVKVFDTTAGRLVVKLYGHLTMLNRIVYGTLRRSKAERAYLHAFRLRKLGIDTPEAIAFVETRRHGVLHESYFVSRCSDLRPMRPVTEQFAQTRQGADILDALAFFLLRMHDSGILHNDLNISNILYGDDTGGQYRFQVIDTNRMSFNHTLSMRQRLDNLRRLSCPHTGLSLHTRAIRPPQECRHGVRTTRGRHNAPRVRYAPAAETGNKVCSEPFPHEYTVPENTIAERDKAASSANA